MAWLPQPGERLDGIGLTAYLAKQRSVHLCLVEDLADLRPRDDVVHLYECLADAPQACPRRSWWRPLRPRTAQSADGQWRVGTMSTGRAAATPSASSRRPAGCGISRSWTQCRSALTSVATRCTGLATRLYVPRAAPGGLASAAALKRPSGPPHQ